MLWVGSRLGWGPGMRRRGAARWDVLCASAEESGILREKWASQASQHRSQPLNLTLNHEDLLSSSSRRSLKHQHQTHLPPGKTHPTPSQAQLIIKGRREKEKDKFRRASIKLPRYGHVPYPVTPTNNPLPPSHPPYQHRYLTYLPVSSASHAHERGEIHIPTEVNKPTSKTSPPTQPTPPTPPHHHSPCHNSSDTSSTPSRPPA